MFLNSILPNLGHSYLSISSFISYPSSILIVAYSIILYEEVIKFYNSAKAPREAPMNGIRSVMTEIAYVNKD